MRRAAFVLAFALAGCDCGGETTLRPVATPIPTESNLEEEAPGAIALPHTSRTDLLAATATLFVDVHPRGYVVTNRSLVESWPAAERARAAASASPTTPDFPIVEAMIPTVDPAPLLLPSLRDAISRASEADRARDPAAGTPIVFSIHAPSDVRWERILRALFAAGMAGYSEPWLIVVDGANIERAIPIASTSDPMDDTSANIRDALAALTATDPIGGVGDEEAEALAPEVSPELAPTAPSLALRLEDHGLRVRSGLVDLSSDCRSPSVDGSPAFTTATLDRESLAACLATVGAFDHATFEAAPEVAYGSALMILETVQAQGRPLSIAMRGSESGR